MPAKLLQNSLFALSVLCLLLTVHWTLQRYGYLVPQNKPIIGDIQIAGAASYTGKLTSPSAIALPSLGINLPVVISHMQGKTWPTTPSGVTYLANTAIPGDLGNAVFYGHNWPSLLGSLKNTKTGDKLIIQYQDGQTRDFTVDGVKTVAPNSTEILESTDSAKITLYTCTGFLDTQRLVVTAM